MGMQHGGGGRRGDRPRESRAGEDLEEIVVKVKRCAKVVKGGKRFSFNALVVVGDRKGRVGWGYGKANEVPFAVNKGIMEGKKSLIRVPVVRNTIPHEIRQKHGATEVILRPACEGTGIKAGASARTRATTVVPRTTGSPASSRLRSTRPVSGADTT